MAARSPVPATSPTTTPIPPSGSLNASNQSPPTPTSSAGTNRLANSRPSNTGSPGGSKLCCNVRAADRSAAVCCDHSALAMRLAANCNTVGVVVIELTRTHRPDVHHAEQPAVSDQRHPKERAHSFLPQDRIDHRVRSNPVEYHRGPGRGDSTGEASTQRHTDALMHLLLEAPCGAGDESRARRVEQQDRHGVNRQQFLDPGDQFVQQFRRVKVYQCGVGQGLQSPQPLARVARLTRHGRETRASAARGASPSGQCHMPLAAGRSSVSQSPSAPPRLACRQ